MQACVHHHGVERTAGTHWTAACGSPRTGAGRLEECLLHIDEQPQTRAEPKFHARLHRRASRS